jgi:hypothetical protein
MLNMLANPRTDRQRRTRDLLGSVAAYGAGALTRKLAGPPSKAARAPSVAQVIRMSHEPKNLDLSASSSTSTTAYSVTVLNNISQGVGGVNRTGRQVLLENLRIQLIFSANAATETGDVVRIIIVKDKECRGVTPGLGDVLTNNTYGLSSIASSHNFDNVPSRFQIIYDEVVALHPTSYYGTVGYLNNPYYPVLINKKLGSKTHYYNTNAGNVTDIDSGGLFMFILNNSGSAQTTYQLDQRLVFRDI